MPQSLLWIGIALVVGGAWLARYDVQTVPGGNFGGAYVLDRWTGSVTFCSAVVCRRASENPPQ